MVSKTKAPAKGEQLSARSWLDEGLNVLREHGEQALTIDRLCVNLGRTKGSFYHHFGGLLRYVDRLLQHWELRDTEGIINQADEEQDPVRRRERLDSAVKSSDTRLDVAVHAWGLRDARARAVVERVDQRRVAYLASLWRSHGASTAQAMNLARFEYAAFIGCEQLLPALSPRAARDLERTFFQAMEGWRLALSAPSATPRLPTT